MRIHSDTLRRVDVEKTAIGLEGVYVSADETGSRSRARGFTVHLAGNGYRVNTGHSGAGYENGATWDEWGVVLARLFEQDPKMLVGTKKYPIYDGVWDFHMKTGERFYDGELPDDTHKRHTWRGPRWGQTCVKCSAERVM